jgi:GNAT superfamily N-acetyltransferase
MGAVDAALVAAWLAGRSLSRGLPLPVQDHGGLRVDSGEPEERCRYVFAAPAEGLRCLGEAIREPFVAIKLCRSGDELMRLLPARWALASDHCMMVCGAPPPPSPVPAGYTLALEADGAAMLATLRDTAQAPVASGRAVEHGGAFVLDQIRTDEAHRRRGLASAVVGALLARRRSPASRPVLTATEEGRALYLRLGWQTYCPYSTAVIPHSRS